MRAKAASGRQPRSEAIGKANLPWFPTCRPRPGAVFRARGPLAKAVVDEMKAAGVYVFAGGLEEEPDAAFSADATSGTLTFTEGPYVENPQFLGGFTVVEVADEQAARMWAGKLAEACG